MIAASKPVVTNQNFPDWPRDVQYSHLLYEYRDLFIDMDVRNNRSELAIASRH